MDYGHDVMTNEEKVGYMLGDLIGYGRLMHLAQQCWRKKLAKDGLEGGEFATGPCVAFIVPCPHPENGKDADGHCDWCCGSGWVTKRVLQAIEATQ